MPGLPSWTSRITTQLNLIAIFVSAALCSLTFVSLHFARDISQSAVHMQAESLGGIADAAELGVLGERHRRLVEGAPYSGSEERHERDRHLAGVLAKRMQSVATAKSQRLLAPIARLLPDLFARADRVFDLAATSADARQAVLDYAVIAQRVQDRIVTYREMNTRIAEMDMGLLTRSVHHLVNFVLLAALFVATLAGPLTIAAMRRVAGRISEITQTMQSLSRDKIDTAIPHTQCSDEVGEMARAISVFKFNAISLREKHEEIANLHARLDVALNNMVRGLSMFDRNGCLIVCNAVCRKMYNLPPAATAPGTPFRDMIMSWALRSSTRPAADIETSINGWLAAHAAKVALDLEFSETHHTEDGRVYLITTKPLPDGGWVDVHEDITEKQRNSQRIADLAQKDALTGLANRHSFMEELHAAFDGGAGARAFALFWIDLDRFKEVNDTCGHAAGDALLRIVGERLRGAVRAQDFVARLGGDEFAIVLRGDDLPDAALNSIAERLRRVVCAPSEVLGHHVQVGASIGIAKAPADVTNAMEIMKAADVALYRAKADGRGKAVVYDASMAEDEVKKVRLSSDLKEALAHDALELHFTPIVSLASGDAVAFEAYVHWEHPDFGRISEAELLTLAEDAGVGPGLGTWVLNAACAAATAWQGDARVCVNLVAAQFDTGQLAETVRAALSRAALAASRLELQIMEAQLLADFTILGRDLQDLKALGISIALGAFGTSHASLGQLQQFPFDAIRLDRRFVRGGATEPGGGITMLRALTDLAHTLGMRAVAEGVETEEHLVRIRLAHCDEAQGPLFAQVSTSTCAGKIEAA